jgi:GAF domain-containing protein
MPMRATTVRFSEDLWDLLEAEAVAQSISAAQFVRDSAIMRLGVLSGRRGDRDAVLTLEELAAGALSGRQPAPDPALGSVSRLKDLHETRLLDSMPDEAFDRLAQLAAKLLNAPVALISLVDDERQFFKSCFGLAEPWNSARETPLSHSFCRHALGSPDPLVIEDARTHPLVRDNLAIRDLDIVAYAGVPLITPSGHALGTLCVIDHQPRSWTSDQIETLKTLTAAVVSEIELARARTAA